MEEQPDWFAEALASGDADRVNDAIDRIEEYDATERFDHYMELFDACRPVYDESDGYVRQSVVRFLRDAYPRLEIQISGTESETVEGIALSDLDAQRERLVEFLLEAITDDDGRVRRAAIDGFRTMGTALSLAGLTNERDVILDGLDDRLAEVSDEAKREHIEEAYQHVNSELGLTGLLSDVVSDVK